MWRESKLGIKTGNRGKQLTYFKVPNRNITFPISVVSVGDMLSWKTTAGYGNCATEPGKLLPPSPFHFNWEVIIMDLYFENALIGLSPY